MSGHKDVDEPKEIDEELISEVDSDIDDDESLNSIERYNIKGGDDEEDEDDDFEDEEEEEEEEEDESDFDEVIEPISNMDSLISSKNDNDEEEDDEDEDDNYLQKLDKNIRENIISEYHPELKPLNHEEVETACSIVRLPNGKIVDPLHQTVPFVTKYEKARIIGERAKQINSGSKPFIEIDKSVHDGYLIALKEFEEKKIPFIIRRPLPNGGSEFWRLQDLEILQ
jgi:DNA-directed RNA polymerase I, II, and III subunit RPABC2